MHFVCVLFFCSMKHSNCYMVWGGDLVSNQQTRFSQEDMVVGCLVDLATGLMTFTANGKEINTFYQVKSSCEITCMSRSVLSNTGLREVCYTASEDSSVLRWSPTLSCSLPSSYNRPAKTWCSWNLAN